MLLKELRLGALVGVVGIALAVIVGAAIERWVP